MSTRILDAFPPLGTRHCSVVQHLSGWGGLQSHFLQPPSLIGSAYSLWHTLLWIKIVFLLWWGLSASQSHIWSFLFMQFLVNILGWWLSEKCSWREIVPYRDSGHLSCVFSFFPIILLIYLWLLVLCRCMGVLSLWCTVFSLQGLLLCRAQASGARASVVVARGLSSGARVY